MATTIYPNSGKVYRVKEILNAVLDGADLTGINGYDPQEVLNMIFDESAAALKVKLAGGTPLVDGIEITPGDSPSNPSTGKLLVYWDTDNVMHVIDENGNEVTYSYKAIQEASMGGSVIFADVNSSVIYSQLLAKTFDKNVLLRDGDEQTQSSGTTIGGLNAVSTGDVCLLVSDVSDNSLSALASFYPFSDNAVARLSDTTMIYTQILGNTGRLFGLATAPATDGSMTHLTRSSISGTSSMTLELDVFNLTALGTLTAEQALMVNSLATLYGWTLTGTVDTSTAWEDIATWMATSGDRDEFFSIVIPSHVSSMEPSIVSEVVNRGGNLAYFDGNQVDDSGMVSTLIPTGIRVVNAVAGTFHETRVNFGRMFGDMVIECDATITEGKSYIVIQYADGTNITASSISAVDGTVTVTFTVADMSQDIEVWFYSSANVSETGWVEYTNVQLNQGSTANTYAPPLNSPFTLGSRSENQLRNGNGEEDVQEWNIGDSGTGFSHDGTDFVLNNDDATTAYVTRTGFGGINRTYAINVTDITESNLRIRVVCEAQMDDEAQLTADGWAWTASAYYEKVVSATGEIANYFEGITALSYLNVDATLNDTTKFREVQLIKGEYTLAQLQAKGYVSYEPIYLLSCPDNDGASTVADRIFQQGDKVFLEHNVSAVSGYQYGDPEVDDTELNTDANATADNAGTEANSTTGFTSVNLAGTGANVFQSQGVVKHAGSYAIEADSTDTPTNVARFYKDIGTDFGLVVGQKYRITYWVRHTGTGASDATWNIFLNADNNASSTAQNLETVIKSETTFKLVTWDFIYSLAHRFLVVRESNLDNDGGVFFDDFSCVAFNIQENLAPTLEDITEFASGSLQQPATKGQNHLLTDGNALVNATHYIGLGSFLDNISSVIETKLDIADHTVIYPIKLTTVNAGLANDQAYFFSFADIDDFPDYIPGCSLIEEILKDTDVDSYTLFDNGILVVAGATAPAAGDVLVELKIARADSLTVKTIDLS